MDLEIVQLQEILVAYQLSVNSYFRTYRPFGLVEYDYFGRELARPISHAIIDASSFRGGHSLKKRRSERVSTTASITQDD